MRSGVTQRKKASHLGWALVTIIWFCAVGTGLAFLYTYETRPSSYESSVSTWPAQTSINRDEGKYHLIMFLHPKCPCSRASLSEMKRILTRACGKATVDILFGQPETANDAWTRSALWRQAAAIPSVRVTTDHQGIEAANFGATASGHVVMYAADGNLVFSGGITQSRGHEGANDGRHAIISVLTRSQVQKTRNGPVLTPTYGCFFKDVKDDNR